MSELLCIPNMSEFPCLGVRGFIGLPHNPNSLTLLTSLKPQTPTH